MRDKRKKGQKVDRKDGSRVDGNEISKLFYGAPRVKDEEPQEKENEDKTDGKKKDTE